jgi:hypothetical protein
VAAGGRSTTADAQLQRRRAVGKIRALMAEGKDHDSIIATFIRDFAAGHSDRAER